LKEGTVISGVGDQQALDLLQLAQLLVNRAPGDRVALRIMEARRVAGGYMRLDRVVPVTLR
jgi:S1-C subfamily serine protease